MSGLATFLRYWHTARHLRPIQVTARARYMLRKPPRLNAGAHAVPHLRVPTGPFVECALRAPSMTGPASFTFLNQPGRLDTPADWNDPTQAKLWLYNLHYFDDLNACRAHERTAWHQDLIQRWIEQSPPGEGNGWEPYPLSLRIVNWIKWTLAGHPLSAQAASSLSLQSAALAGQIEWHLLGNHLLANAKALTFAGCFFEGTQAQRWLQQGLAIYERELPEQILSDGGHFERSPMYHAIILEDLLDLVNVGRTFPGTIPPAFMQTLADLCARMLRWLALMCHPDGGISFFNDAAFGVAPAQAELLAYARRLGLAPAAHDLQGLSHLVQSGYVRCARAGAVMLCDCAPVGPDYLPGHAHADTLSFELSLGGERIIVNGGTSVYGTGTDRLRERATAAHSTVVVDDADSSEVWGGFRVARRARVLEVSVSDTASTFEVTASHDGYRRLPGRNIHTRTWTLSDHQLIVADRVTKPYARAMARFHLGPGVSAVVDPSGTSGTLRAANGLEIRWHSASAVALNASRWHPEFGSTVTTQRLDIPVEEGTSRLVLNWKD